MKYSLAFLCLIASSCLSFAQDKDALSSAPPPGVSIDQISSRSLSRLNEQYSHMASAVQSRSEAMLVKLQGIETKLRNKVAEKDSSKAGQLFGSAGSNYQDLLNRLQSPVGAAFGGTIAGAGGVMGAGGSSGVSPLKEYIPNVDTIRNALNFLQQGKFALPAGKLEQIQAVSGSFVQLQSRLQQANEVQAFVTAREQQLTDQLGKYNVSNELLGVNKQVFYYQQQLAQYKDLLRDPDKLQASLLNAVRNVPAFQGFMQKNSYFSTLFPSSPNIGTPAALTGLQTNADTRQQLQDRFGKSALNADASGGGSPIQQQVQSAQAALSKLRDKIMAAGGNSSDMTLPAFTPNQQKTKSFLKRFEYGFNIQSEPGTSLLPATSDLGLTLGYKLSDKATTGVGAAYKLGWGNGLNDVHFSSQGVGLRSFLDIKAKGSFWITGGLEYDYYQAFSHLSDIRNFDVWQKSALIGLTKKYKIGNRNANLQLLYDLLAGEQIPRTSPVRFRVGYSF